MERHPRSGSISELDRASESPDGCETGTDCLSDETILRFVEGQLGTEELAACHRHFDACEACQRLVAEAVHAIGTPHEPVVSQPLGCSLRIGSVVGERYRVERFIARGGMGEVYEAYDRVLNQRIALKTVKSTISDSPKAASRLKAEVQLARRVTHPNVCRLYDLGSQRLTKKVELHFLSMEYIEGISLREKLARDGRLNLEEAVDIARQLLRGLGAAHEAGTLHRDFKPDNVMLRSVADQPTAVIMDFGLAWALDSEATPLSARSHEPLIGTLAYMAPEQVEGTPLGVATDVYSLGIVLFEMLTGRLPFTGESAASSALKRLSEPAPPPSRHNPEIPGHIDRIVLRCLERLPKDRYARAAEVLAALDRPDNEPRRTWLRPRQLAKGAGILAGACLLALASVQAWAPQHRPPADVQPPLGSTRSPELRANRRDQTVRPERKAPLAPKALPSRAASVTEVNAPEAPKRHGASAREAPTPRRRAPRLRASGRAAPEAPNTERILPEDLMLPKSFQPASEP